MLALAAPDAHALISGESVIAFVDRGAVTEGDELDITVTGSRPESEIKSAYRRWGAAPLPAGDWVAVVEAVHPAALLDAAAGSSRHVLALAPAGDLAVVRVYDGVAAVLSDEAFAARRRAVEGALAG